MYGPARWVPRRSANQAAGDSQRHHAAEGDVGRGHVEQAGNESADENGEG